MAGAAHPGRVRRRRPVAHASAHRRARHHGGRDRPDRRPGDLPDVGHDQDHSVNLLRPRGRPRGATATAQAFSERRLRTVPAGLVVHVPRHLRWTVVLFHPAPGVVVGIPVPLAVPSSVADR